MGKRMKLCAVGVAMLILFSATYFFISQSIVAAEPIRIACIGDSITERSGYPDKLRLLLGTNYSVGNFGATGSTVSIHSQKPYVAQPEFQEALNFLPDVVVIMLGTNDANLNLSKYDETFEDDYTKIVASFQNLEGDQQIFVVKSPPIFNNSLNLSNTYLYNNVLPHIDNLANDMNLLAIDVHSVFGDNSEYFHDGVHPRIEGADLIASTIYNKIVTSTD